MNKKIQILKAIAIFAVILIHTVPGSEITLFIRPFINFAVALFIFLSGYLTKIHIDNKKSFYKKRIFRVVIPYILWSLFYTILNHGLQSNILLIYLKNLITSESCYTFYYIIVYIQLVLITPMIEKIVESKYNWIPWFIQPLWIIIMRYMMYILNVPVSSTFIGYFFMAWFSFYYLGILLGNKIFELKISKYTYIITLIMLILQIIEGFIWYKFFSNFDIANSQLKLTTNLTSAAFMFVCYYYLISDKIYFKSDKIFNLLVRVGDYSFGIYLIHPAIITLLNRFAIYNFLIFPFNSILIFIVSFILVFCGNKIFKKNISRYLGLS